MTRLEQATRRHRHRRWIWFLLAATGCGGLGQDDMRKYALQRPSDEELAGNVAQTPATTAQPAGAPSDSPRNVNPPAASLQASSVATHSVANGAPTTATAAAPSAPANPNSAPISDLSDTRSPDPNMSIIDRRQMTIENMKRIMQALESYRMEKGNYPGFAIHSNSTQPLLSWRVELLPYLGYQPLYDQFRQDEPWNSAHNQALVPRIPAVYQSPDRFDEKTNFLVPLGRSTAFSGPRGNHPRRWEDGLQNVVLLLEVDDSAAVPWTAPRDWTFDPGSPGQSLGDLRSDGFFAGWGGGNVARVPRETAVADLRAMFTVDGGEPFQAAAICQAAVAEPEVSPTSVHASDTRATQSPAAEFQVAHSGGTSSGGAVLRSDDASPGSAARFAPTSNSTASGRSARWSERSHRAEAEGHYDEAAQLQFAAFLADEPLAALNSYQWIPALRRPALEVTFGLGADYTGPSVDALRRQLVPPDDSARPLSSQWTTVIGELARPLLDELDSFTAPPNSNPSLRVANHRTASNGPPRGDARLTVIGVAPARRLVRAAQLVDVDLLLLFDIEDKTTRSGVQSKSVQFSVWDTWRAREVFRLPRINYLRLQHAEPDPLARDPIDEAAKAFRHFLREQLQPQPLPTALTAERAAQRVTQLSAMKRDNPLPLLSEMKFYHQCGLVNAEQLLNGYQSLIGAETAAALLAGTDDEKRAVLNDWLR